MATSRRRERDLARRRFERRRQAELERRAKAKKRNTVLGAVVGTIVIVAALVGGGFAIFGGSGNSKKPAAGTTPSISPATTPDASSSASTSASAPASTPASSTTPPAAPTKCAAITPNPPAAGEPAIPQPKGKLSTKLVTKDIKVGTGAPAKNGDAVTVQYVGVSCDSGKAFDASYTDGAANKEFTFTIGSTVPGKSVIAGWNQGVVGMKAGGVRELVIPSALAYGTAGGGSAIPANDTLVFVIHMVKV